ncbi:hypothetical protein F2Q70_00038710 [Brassica cretica]|uniref:Uncharacterized protein n=1 Tax=Brassica cretica TaxID=69181 RepID=A0A8S9KBE9_BRACR|nr:hypothetical protein F2Q70_00038710 [Brassica cretica]
MRSEGDFKVETPIDRRAPLTFRVQLPKIDITQINALGPQPKPSANPPESTSTHSEDAPDLMQVDKATMGRTVRKRKEKVAKHLKRGANEKEMERFLKRVLRIPLEKPFEEAYFTHILWMFFRETKEIEEDIGRMFHQIGNALVPVDFHVLDIKLDWNSSLLLGKAFLSTVGAICNMQTNQLFLALIDPHVYYDPIPKSIETHIPTSINSLNHHKSIENLLEESIGSSPDDSIEDFTEGSIDSWENDYYNPTFAVDTTTPSDIDIMHTEEYDEDYEEERAIEYHALLTEEDRLLHYSNGIRNATSTEVTPHQSILIITRQTVHEHRPTSHLPIDRRWSRPCTRRKLFNWQLGR